jgi:FMN-dependent NADH-azoreductase
MKLLHIDSGILGDQSVTRQLSAKLVEDLKARHKGLEVTYRDLASHPLSHLSGTHLMAAHADRATVPAEVRKELDEGAKILDELLAADLVVIGAPMYNFSIPSQLKAWIDRIVVAGKTFSYTEKGPEGLVSGKRVVIVSSRGGVYSGASAMAALDHQEAYLRATLGFIGMTAIEFLRAEGVNMGPQQKLEAVAAAEQAITTGTFAKAA